LLQKRWNLKDKNTRKNIFSNTNGYSSTATERANDINEMFADKEVK